jgi:hypothetical protein
MGNFKLGNAIAEPGEIGKVYTLSWQAVMTDRR